MTVNPSQLPPAEAITSPKSRVIGGRYRVQRQLKTRVDTETLLALDQTNGQQVVVKTTAATLFSASVRMRLEHEAHVLSKIQKGRFAPLLDYGTEDDQVYLVMPFIPGITLQARLKQGALSVRDTIQVGRAILTALSAAHASDVLHRDVRPANIIVNEESDLHEATLIDFGLAHSAGLDARILHKWVGTAQYLSPEAAGLLDQEVTACSDLYSTGIVLFECLAGRPPFEGKSVGEVLRQHMTAQPPELRSLGLSVPRVLDEVIQRLLRKDPRERYQTARAVFSDLSMIEESLRRGESEPNLVVGLRDQRRTLTEPAFVGRGQELALLNAQLERTQSGERGLVLLEAESGGGKSRLLQEFAQRGAQQGAWILRGQGLNQAAQRPFQLLSGVAEGIMATARLEPGIDTRIQTALGDHLDGACLALPELATLLGSREFSELGPESFAETRSVQALTALLDSLGGLGRTVLVLLDDCQWADQLTLKVLSNWQRRQETANHPVLLVVAFRTEEVPEGHPLRALRSAAHLSLPTFQAANVRKLVESMAGPLPDEAVSVIERLAEGSPFMAAAALRGLVESGALVPIPTGWRVEPLAMADVQSSRHAAAFLSRRIELLPEASINLLSVGAVLGKEFDLSTASTLAGQTAEQAIAALHEAQHRHIVWSKTTNDRCAFVHDKLRQTLLDRLPESERRDLHLQAAIDIEAGNPRRIYDLAYHFDAAGDSHRALPFALAAAEDARTHHALELAEEQYRIADRGDSTDEAIRYQIAEGLGDVLILRGRYEEAATFTAAARDLASTEIDKA
ncbi:MAG TPA: protein kinase, partial [Planctomycetaceae bacterium]|nr:protein kinase [Planctomycetaceae bacterium]